MDYENANLILSIAKNFTMERMQSDEARYQNGIQNFDLNDLLSILKGDIQHLQFAVSKIFFMDNSSSSIEALNVIRDGAADVIALASFIAVKAVQEIQKINVKQPYLWDEKDFDDL
jgi:hypothetical protein